MKDNAPTSLISDKARHVANYLNSLNPFQRALAWHLAEEIWQERAEHRAGRPPSQQEEYEAAELDMACWSLALQFLELSEGSREAVKKLASELHQLERLDAMLEPSEVCDDETYLRENRVDDDDLA